MDKLKKTNKLRESFQNNLPEEQLPDFIWDNVKKELNNSSMVPPSDKMNKIQKSFEGGFEKEVLPTSLWEDIVGDLDAVSTLDADQTTKNNIKSSFENNMQDKLPSHLWGSVQDKLEVETVWKKVRKALNQRTRKRYWQEKGIQLSLVVLAMLWLRGCDVGGTFTTQPVAYPYQTTELAASNPGNNNFSNKNITPRAEQKVDINNLSNRIINSKVKVTTFVVASIEAKKKSKTEARVTVASDRSKTATNEVLDSETKVGNIQLVAKDKVDDSEEKDIDLQHKKEVTTVKAAAVAVIIAFEEKVTKEAQTELIAKSNVTASFFDESYLKDNAVIKTTTAEITKIVTREKVADQNKGNEERYPEIVLNSKEFSVSTESPQNSTAVTNSIIEIISIDAPITSNHLEETTKTELVEPVYIKKQLPQNMLSFLLGGIIEDSSIVEIQHFHIENIAAKRKSSIRFEIGLIGKVGTSLLLGKATDRAMESTSTLKTQIRPAGGVGVMVNCYLTPNDAIVLGAYPFSTSQQYFGGYTTEGRFYHKEIKLSYFDFSFGYQRILFHYNDFGVIPSSVYARIDYGFGYLTKGDEIINGASIEASDSYNKINHSLGLALGNTHKIKRFVVDYGLSASLGVTSVINGNSTTPVVNQSNLMRMGGHIGLRYML
jgi:hypothetical protein